MWPLKLFSVQLKWQHLAHCIISCNLMPTIYGTFSVYPSSLQKNIGLSASVGHTQIMPNMSLKWKKHIYSNNQAYNKFLRGNNRQRHWDSSRNTRCSFIMSESLCVFTALLGVTLINANHKQISLALTHHLSPFTLTTQVSSPGHAHQRHPIW